MCPVHVIELQDMELMVSYEQAPPPTLGKLLWTKVGSM